MKRLIRRAPYFASTAALVGALGLTDLSPASAADVGVGVGTRVGAGAGSSTGAGAQSQPNDASGGMRASTGVGEGAKGGVKTAP